MPQDMVIRRDERRSIRRPLSNDERAATALQLVEAMGEHDLLSSEEAERRKQSKAQIEVAAGRVKKLAAAVRDGQVTEDLDVEVTIDLAANRLTVTPFRLAGEGGPRDYLPQSEDRALTGPEREAELARREAEAQTPLPLTDPRLTTVPLTGSDDDPGDGDAFDDPPPDPFDDDPASVPPDNVNDFSQAWCGKCEHRHAVNASGPGGQPIEVETCVTCGCQEWGDPKFVQADPRCSKCDHYYGRKGQRKRKGIPLHSREAGDCGCGCDAMIPYYEKDPVTGQIVLMPESKRT